MFYVTIQLECEFSWSTNILIHKLQKKLGFSGNLGPLLWITDYLKGRSQREVLDELHLGYHKDEYVYH